jgi:hypothetical protein
MSSAPITDSDEFYVFVDMDNPLTFHNITFTRSMSSASYPWTIQDSSLKPEYLAGTLDYLPFIVNERRSKLPLSSFSASIISAYRVEYDAEITRRLNFPLAPSRLSALYAFSSLDDCKEAHRLYGWDLDSVRRFRLVKDSFTKVARVNMEIVSLMRRFYHRVAWREQTIDEIWAHYWSGRGSLDVEIPVVAGGSIVHRKFSSGEIWEYLIEGRLNLVQD